MATVDTSFLNAFYSEESLEISNVIQEKDKILDTNENLLQHVAPVLSVDKQQIIIMVHICVRYKTCRFLERMSSWR